MNVLSHIWVTKSYRDNIVILFLTAKDESKSPVRSSGRISVTAPPSRKTSTANNVSLVSYETNICNIEILIQNFIEITMI